MAEQPRGDAQAEALGAMAARLGKTLRGFFHPAAGHDLLWDLKQAGAVVDLVPHIEAAPMRDLAARALDVFVAEVAPRLKSLRAQVIHNDLNPSNILVDPADPVRICGVIDFGDMVHGALVNDVAIAAAYVGADASDPMQRMARFVGAYHAVAPLEREEAALLPDLIATRYAMTLAITGWRAKRYPENSSYIVRNQASAMTGLTALAQAGGPAARESFLAACGYR